MPTNKDREVAKQLPGNYPRSRATLYSAVNAVCMDVNLMGCVQDAHLDRVHTIHARSLEDGVVGLVGGIQDAIWQVLSTHQDAMQIALCAAIRDVAPVLILIDLPKPRKPLQNSNLQAATAECQTLLGDLQEVVTDQQRVQEENESSPQTPSSEHHNYFL